LRAGGAIPVVSGEFSPAVDVYETDHALEIATDLPGVDAQAVRIMAIGAAVLIVGEKAPRRGRGDSSFHLVEREFGRFALVVRFSAACDTSRARVTLQNGELRLSLPKVAERRGQRVPLSIGSAS
jgi:HSP20 family protein